MWTLSQPRRSAYWRLARFDRPIGIYLLLWPTLWALWFAAGGVPPLPVLAVFLVGTALMRGAGCAINDYADRCIDGGVARTRRRPLVSGELCPADALRLAAVLALAAFALVCWLGDPGVLLLSVPAVLIAALYPFTKRWLAMPQAVLGVAFSWGIPMAYAALGGDVRWSEALTLMAANLCWVVAYDTFYAMADRPDDVRIGVRSSAILFGRHDRLLTAMLQVLALALLAWVGRERGGLYFLGLAGAAAFALQEQWMIRRREPAACFAAFLHSHRFGLAVFAGLALDFALAESL